MFASQIALQYDVEVAVGDDWALRCVFALDGDPLDVSGETFTADILDRTGVPLSAFTQTVSGDDFEVLTISTLDLALASSPLYRYVLRTSTLADRGLVGGAFIVRPTSGAARLKIPVYPVVDLGNGVTMTVSPSSLGTVNNLNGGAANSVQVRNIDGGNASTNYGTTTPFDGGDA